MFTARMKLLDMLADMVWNNDSDAISSESRSHETKF